MIVPEIKKVSPSIASEEACEPAEDWFAANKRNRIETIALRIWDVCLFTTPPFIAIKKAAIR
jgi:hypothetical protein